MKLTMLLKLIIWHTIWSDQGGYDYPQILLEGEDLDRNTTPGTPNTKSNANHAIHCSSDTGLCQGRMIAHECCGHTMS
jgi:hypothetical protein